MNAMWLAVLAAAQDEGGGMGPFEVEFGLIFWTWLVFFVLMYLLYKFAWPALVQATEEREKKIQAQLAEAEKAHAESRAALEEAKRLAAEARASAQQLLTDARQAAEKERAHAAGADAARSRRSCWSGPAGTSPPRRTRRWPRSGAKPWSLSLAAATKLVGQRLDSDTDRRLVTEYLDSVEIKN